MTFLTNVGDLVVVKGSHFFADHHFFAQSWIF